MRADPDEHRVDEIRLWFHEQGRELLLKDLGDQGWDAIIPVHGIGAHAAPGATGSTRREAAENVVVEYLRRPDLGGGKDLTPP
jgi:hypothetical protein